MKTFEVWMEGYSITGNCSGATYYGKYKAKRFKSACLKAMVKNKMLNDYNLIDNTYWGCRLYDNETGARKSFG